MKVVYQDDNGIEYLSCNAGSLTTAFWEELLYIVETLSYSEVKIVLRDSWQFSKGKVLSHVFAGQIPLPAALRGEATARHGMWRELKFTISLSHRLPIHQLGAAG